MKKSIFFLSIFTLVIFIITGCEKKVTTEDVSTLTYFVTYDLEGGELMTIPAGSPFVDPGFIAMEGTTDVTSKVKVTGSVDGLSVGLYALTYSAVNKDGYPSSVTRTVIIYDPDAPATDISGIYDVYVIRRTIATGAIVAKRGPYPFTIEKKAPGFFSVTDFWGGYYQYGAAYGASYACGGYMQLNADNTLEHVSSVAPAWGYTCSDFYNGVYDPATKGLVWSAVLLGAYEFNVELIFN